MNVVVAVIMSYLLGSIPTAYLFGRFLQGIDIREYGSGNVGATNAIRVLGKVPGSIVLLLDIGKGALALTVVGDVFGLDSAASRIFLALAVVAGHNWTIFLNFKGGKGIATSLGVLIGLTIEFPELRGVLFICLLAWLISFLVSGIVSISSIIAATVLPVAMVLTAQSFAMILLGVIFCLFVIIRHRPNIKRLFSGQEPKVDLPFLRKKNPS